MQKWQNILLSFVLMLILAGPSMLYCAEMVGLGLPSWLTSENAKYLSGGAEETSVGSVYNLEGFFSKKLQGEMETGIDNHIPLKAQAMLGNAALQRSAICASNILFNWQCYPSFFGSTRLVIPSENAVTYLPAKRSPEHLGNLTSFAENVNTWAKQHPDKRIAVCLVQGYQDPEWNPAFQLVSNPRLPHTLVSALSDGLTADNAFFITTKHDSLSAYYEDFFRTDHHWNYKGCIKAYNEIASKIGLDTYPLPSKEQSLEGYYFSGATARFGLVSTDEPAHINTDPFSQLTILAPDGIQSNYNHEAFFQRNDYGKRYVFYDAYYGVFPNKSLIKGPGTRTGLVLCNSYGAGIMPYIAMQYETVLDMQSIHPSRHDATERLSKIVSLENVDDVYILANAHDIAGFYKDCPEFFAD